MNRFVFQWAAVIALVAAAGCSKTTPESLAREMLAGMEGMTGVLKGVTDEASAKAAGPKLTAAAQAIKRLAEAGEKMQKENPQAKVDPNLQSEFLKKAQALTAEMLRIMANPKLKAALGDAVKELDAMK